MPFYEYECPSCRYYLEVLQKINDPPLKKCPSCGKTGFKRLMSVPVFRLKGSGWYETDFKSDKDSQRNLAGTERGEAGDKAKGESAETKAAAPEAGKTGDQTPAAKPDAGADTPEKPAARSSKVATPARTGKGTSAPKPAPKRARRAARPATRRKKGRR